MLLLKTNPPVAQTHTSFAQRALSRYELSCQSLQPSFTALPAHGQTGHPPLCLCDPSEAGLTRGEADAGSRQRIGSLVEEEDGDKRT